MRKIFQGAALATLLVLVGCLGLGSVALPVYAGAVNMGTLKPLVKQILIDFELLDASGEPATPESGWTDNGGTVTATTAGDGVGIGAGTVGADEILDVKGDATRKNVFLATGTAGTLTIECDSGGLTLDDEDWDLNHGTLIKLGAPNVQITSGLLSVSEREAPSTPAAEQVAIYAKADGLLYSKDDAGVETLLSRGSGGVWTAYTPGSTWSANSTHSAHYLLDGNTMTIRFFTVLSGAPTSATYAVDLPATYYVDESKITNSSTDEPLMGAGSIYDTGWKYSLQPHYITASSRIGIRAISTLPTSASVTQAFPITFGNDDRIHFWVQFPVTTVDPDP